MLWKFYQRTFNGGQLDRRLGGRTDVGKYFQGASVLENFIVKRQGCIVRRRGTYLIADVTARVGYSDIDASRLIPFSFESESGYVILLFHSVSGGSFICVFGKDGGRRTPSLIRVPYEAGEISEVGVDQSGDMIYMAHREHPFARLVRKSETNWTYEPVNFELLGRAASEVIPPPKIVSFELLPSGEWSGTGPEASVSYCATSVKDGIESAPSDPIKVSYPTPWPQGCSIKLTIDANGANPDCFNIYKKRFSTPGYIGTTAESGVARVTDIPGETYNDSVASRRTLMLRKRSSGTIATGTTRNVFSTDRTKDNGTNGYVVRGGVLTETFDNAVDADSFTIGLGYVWYVKYYKTDRMAAREAKHWVQYIPCNARKIGCEVIYADGSRKDLGKVEVPEQHRGLDTDNSITGDPASSAVAALVEEKRSDMSRKVSLTWNITDRGAKKVRSVTFTAYDDADEVADGNVSFSSDPATDSAASIRDTVFTVNGVWATRRTDDISYEFLDEYVTPDTSVTPPVYEPKFAGSGDYPGCVAIYQQRLALARTTDQPFTFWLSCVGDIYNFNTHESVRDDDAMEVTLPATKYPDINHMVMNRDLIMFCDSGEWIVSPLNGNAMTPKSVQTKIQSQIGCSKSLAPIVVGDDIIFANSTNETLFAIRYSYASDGYESTDLSVLSQDIFRGNPITSIAFKKNPDSILLATLQDGSFATLEYMKEHEVVAWSRHGLGGGLKALYCCADGSTTDGTTDVYILARNAEGRILLLRTKEDSNPASVSACVTMDAIEEMTAATGQTVPAGRTAVDLLSGEVKASGALVAGRSYAIGHPFVSRFVSVKPEPNSSETIRYEVKNPTAVQVSMTDGSSYRVGQLGQPEAKDRLVTAEPAIDASDGSVVLAGKDVATNVYGANGRDARVRLTADGVWPLTVLSMVTTYQIESADQEPRGGEGGGND